MKIRERRLSNGMEVFYSSGANLDMLEKEMFTDNVYDWDGIRLKDGDCVFDVGANIGFFVMYLNQRLSEASVFSFEPIPDTFELLQRNSQRHNRLDLKTFNCGLADQAGQATFRHYPATSVASTMFPVESAGYRADSRRFILDEIRGLHPALRWWVAHTPVWSWWPITELVRRHYQRSAQVVCQLRTISDVIDQHQVQQIDCLKIDTEGAEMTVLRGMRAEHWPRVRQAMIETHDGQKGAQKVVDLLREHGFKTHVGTVCDSLEHLSMIYATRLAATHSATATQTFKEKFANKKGGVGQ